jgi:hypothetical protein
MLPEYKRAATKISKQRRYLAVYLLFLKNGVKRSGSVLFKEGRWNICPVG